MKSKLTLNDAIRIRVEVKHGATPEQMAERYRVSQPQIQAILSRQLFSVRHITEKLKAKRLRGIHAKKAAEE
jgi:hypothetical protein